MHFVSKIVQNVALLVQKRSIFAQNIHCCDILKLHQDTMLEAWYLPGFLFYIKNAQILVKNGHFMYIIVYKIIKTLIIKVDCGDGRSTTLYFIVYHKVSK